LCTNSRSRSLLAATLAACGLIVVGCSASRRPDVSATTAQLDAATARYAGFVHAMAADSIASMYAPDGEMLGAGMHPIQSPDSIRAFLSSFTNVRVDSQSMSRDAITIGDTESVVWGTYTQAATVTGQPQVHVSGRFVAEWVRRADGTWKIRRMLTQPAPVGR
jgi:uncharacterized protein (TIGR02246 family)